MLSDVDLQAVASLGVGASTSLADVFAPISILVLPSTLRRPAFVKGIRRDDMTTRAIADIIRANESLRVWDARVEKLAEEASRAGKASPPPPPLPAPPPPPSGKPHKKKPKGELLCECEDALPEIQHALRAARNSAREAFVALTHKVFAHFTADQDDDDGFARLKHKTALTKETKSLRDLLSSKDGWLRRHMLSGRINNCARAVVAPDMAIDVDCLVLPLDIALTLSVTCVVTDFNLAVMREFVVLGAAVYGGAQSVSFSSTHTVTLGGMPPSKRREVATSLQVGCVVHRSIQDGDYLIFNRQPTLHRFGMICQRIIVDRSSHNKTIRIPPELCGPTNADFDGDEVNCNALTTPEGQADARILMSPESMMESNPSVFGALQDVVMGAMLLTRGDQPLLRPTAVATLVGAIARPAQHHHRVSDVHTGREIVELLFPATFAYDYCGVRIVDGRFCAGSAPLSKSHLERSMHSVAAILTLDFSARQALHFLSDLRRLVTTFLNTIRSVTIEFADVVPDAASLKMFRAAETSAMCQYARCAATGPDDDREQLISLAHLPAVAEDISSHKEGREGGWARDFNGLNEFVSSGGKGSWRNVAQMSVGIGQQVIVDDRLARGSDGRTLPTFAFNDRTAEADGWVHESYLQGMNPSSMFIAACGGRAGVAATYCRTAECGYLFRRMYSLLNCLQVDYVGVTRGSDGRVVVAQYLDGFLPDTLESIDCSPWLWMPHPHADVETLRRQLVDVRRRCAVASHMLYVPINWHRLRAMSASAARAAHQQQQQQHEPIGWGVVLAFLGALERLAWDCGYNLLQLRLHIAHVASGADLSAGQFAWLADETFRRVQRCAACAGTPVGSTASEKTESSTQTTLRSFHTAGQAMSRDDLKNLLLLAERKNHVVSATIQLAGNAARSSQDETTRAASALVAMRLSSCCRAAGSLSCCVAGEGDEDDAALAGRVDREWARARRLGIVGGCWRTDGVVVWEAVMSAREVGKAQTTMPQLVDRVAAQLPEHSAVWIGNPNNSTVVGGGGGGGGGVGVVLYIASCRSNACGRAAVQKLVVGGNASVLHAKCVAATNRDSCTSSPQFAVHVVTRSVPALAACGVAFDLTTLRLDCPIATARHWGIEAALSVLSERLDNAFGAPEGRFAHHSALIASFLCMCGSVHKLDRFDIHKLNSDVLSTAAFESPVPVLQEAALRGVTNDNIRRSTTASTILSTTPKIGSGLVELIVPARARVAMLRRVTASRPMPRAADALPIGSRACVWWDVGASGHDHLAAFDRLVCRRACKKAKRRARTVPLVAARPSSTLLGEFGIVAPSPAATPASI